MSLLLVLVLSSITKTRVPSVVRDDNSRFDKPSYQMLIPHLQKDAKLLGEFIGCDTDFWDLSESRWCDKD